MTYKIEYFIVAVFLYSIDVFCSPRLVKINKFSYRPKRTIFFYKKILNAKKLAQANTVMLGGIKLKLIRQKNFLRNTTGNITTSNEHIAFRTRYCKKELEQFFVQKKLAYKKQFLCLSALDCRQQFFFLDPDGMLLEIVTKNVNKEQKNKVLIRLDDLVFDHITKNISSQRVSTYIKELLSRGFVSVPRAGIREEGFWFSAKSWQVHIIIRKQSLYNSYYSYGL
jgi:hypothetical protein